MTTKDALMVNVKDSWPRVQKQEITAEQSVLQDWAQLPGDDARIDDIKVVLGMFRNRAVAVFDVHGWERVRDEQGRLRVRFHGVLSESYAHLVGAPNPGWLFDRQGAARAVQLLPLDHFTSGAPVEQPEPGVQRAVVAGYVLTVQDGAAVLDLPPGGSATVRAAC